MEDVGGRPTLSRWLRDRSDATIRKCVSEVGRALAPFISRLHATTCDDPTCAEAFANQPMQETRHAVQAAARYLRFPEEQDLLVS